MALVAVGAVRAAPWLWWLCLPTACLCGVLAVAGGRSISAMLQAGLAYGLSPVRANPWGLRGLASARTTTASSAARTLAATVVGLVLLLVFGALLAGADVAFADMLDNILPTVDAGAVTRWVLTGTVVGLGTLSACYLALRPPTYDREPPGTRRTLRRIEWGIPVGALVVLFAAFLVVQATVLFGGNDHVLKTAGLTYAEYARQGFWQLLAVTALTLIVIAVAARLAARDTMSDIRGWARALLGALAALTLVIVASALSRMWAYEEAYGFTVLRLLVSVCEAWLRTRLRADPRGWCSAARSVGAAGGRPGRRVGADRHRRASTPTSSSRRRMSPATRTPTRSTCGIWLVCRPMRPRPSSRSATTSGVACSNAISDDLASRSPDTWNEWNLGRQRARAVLAAHPVTSTLDCYDVLGRTQR